VKFIPSTKHPIYKNIAHLLLTLLIKISNGNVEKNVFSNLVLFLQKATETKAQEKKKVGE
jgi:hypothetical protein